MIKRSEGGNFARNNSKTIREESIIALTQKPMDGGEEVRSRGRKIQVSFIFEQSRICLVREWLLFSALRLNL